MVINDISVFLLLQVHMHQSRQRICVITATFPIPIQLFIRLSNTTDHGYFPLVVITIRPFHDLSPGLQPEGQDGCHMWSRNLVHLRILVGFVLFNHLFSVQCFVDRCLSFCTFSFAHCVVCPSSIYGFRWPFQHLQTVLKKVTQTVLLS